MKSATSFSYRIIHQVRTFPFAINKIRTYIWCYVLSICVFSLSKWTFVQKKVSSCCIFFFCCFFASAFLPHFLFLFSKRFKFIFDGYKRKKNSSRVENANLIFSAVAVFTSVLYLSMHVHRSENGGTYCRREFFFLQKIHIWFSIFIVLELHPSRVGWVCGKIFVTFCCLSQYTLRW